MEFTRLIDAVIRKLWLVVLLSLVGAALSGLYSVYMVVPVYKSEATLYIMNRSNTKDITYNDMMLSKQLIQDYSEIIKSRKVLSPVVNEINIDGLTEERLRQSISVVLKADSNVMTISAQWTDPITAADIASTTSRAFIGNIKELTNIDIVGLLDDALVSTRPVPMGQTKKVLAGFIVGLVAALLIIYVLELFDPSIRSAENVEKGLGLKVVGIIPKYNIH